MPVPSLPLEIIVLIASHADRTTLARCALVQQSWLQLCQRQLYRSLTISRRHELDDRVRDPRLLATLQLRPELAAYVRKLYYNGWYQDWESFEEDQDDEWYSDEEDRSPRPTQPVTIPDDLYLAQLLKCCTGLRRLEIHGAYLWIDDLVLTPRLVSLTFADGVLLRSRHKKPELLALPSIRHLNVGKWEQPRNPHRREPNIDIFDFEDLGPSSIALFSSVTHLDCEALGFRAPKQLSDALQHILPNLQSLTLGSPGIFLAWTPLLPLCTSLRQLGCSAMPSALSAIESLRQAPPSLAFLLLCAPVLHVPAGRELCRKFTDAMTSSVDGLEGLRALQLDLDYPTTWESDLATLVQVCKRKGMTLRLRDPRQPVGRRLVRPKKGEKEVEWTQIWSQVPL